MSLPWSSFFVVWSTDEQVTEKFATLLEAQIAAQKLAANHPARYYVAEVCYSVEAANLLTHNTYASAETKEPTCLSVKL